MNKFVSSIRKKYQGRCINFEKQFPPASGQSNKLINLDIVERDKMQLKGQDVKQTPLAYEDLFKTGSQGRPVRKILVEGDAGIGKTSLTFRISEDWADGKLFQQFDLLLLLPLRQTEVSSARSLPDLLKLLHSSPSSQDSVARYIQENEGEKVLIIADGWDELSEANRREDSFLYKLLFKMPFISVMLTSRPLASAPLHRLWCFDQFIEIKGFNRASIEEYIQSEFIDDVDKQKGSRLLERLESNPLVASLCSVPLNCTILCHLWRTTEEALPTTMAEMFKKIILNVILRNFSKLIPNYDRDSIMKSKLPDLIHYQKIYKSHGSISVSLPMRLLRRTKLYSLRKSWPISSHKIWLIQYLASAFYNQLNPFWMWGMRYPSTSCT